MKTTLLVLFLLFATGSFAQEHAPTLEQCRADQKAWNMPLMVATTGPFSHSVSSLPTSELIDRGKEMLTCGAVDSKNITDYHGTAMLLFSFTTARLGMFVQETNQMDHFMEWEQKHQQAEK